LRAVVGVLGSINQAYLKKLLGYSSVFMTAWLLACESKFGVRIEYLRIYRAALVVLTLVVRETRVLEVGERLTNLTIVSRLALAISFLRIGGCPPLLGFYAKLSVILTILVSGH
jgi:NADH:ubiquinone oxidoreductase subunit 2 (subunit N)